MTEEEMKGFTAGKDELNPEEYLILDYYFESVTDPYEAAIHLCQEQSTVQWKRVGLDEDFREKHGAKLIDFRELGKVPTAAFSVFREEYPESKAARAVIAHPCTNFGTRIPNLFTAVCGEGIFFSPGISAIKLMDIIFPDSYLNDFQGPQFGIDGIRDILGVYDRPILLGVIKPNLGLPAEDFADLGYKAWSGGLDIAKDDEMLSDRPWLPLAERTRLLTEARLKAEAETGEKKIYLANITDEVDRIPELYDLAVSNGANSVMVNTLTTGLSAVRMLRKHASVPIVAHFAGKAPSVGVNNYGVHSKVLTKIERMLGCDAVIMPGFNSRMKVSETEVMENVEECLNPLGSMKRILPVPAGSNWVGDLEDIHKRTGSVDFGIVPGRAVFNHPMGPESGSRGLREGWEAVASGTDLNEYAESHKALKGSLEM